MHRPSVLFMHACANVSVFTAVCVWVHSWLFTTQYPQQLHRQYYQHPYPAEAALSGEKSFLTHTGQAHTHRRDDCVGNVRGCLGWGLPLNHWGCHTLLFHFFLYFHLFFVNLHKKEMFLLHRLEILSSSSLWTATPTSSLCPPLESEDIWRWCSLLTERDRTPTRSRYLLSTKFTPEVNLQKEESNKGKREQQPLTFFFFFFFALATYPPLREEKGGLIE